MLRNSDANNRIHHGNKSGEVGQRVNHSLDLTDRALEIGVDTCELCRRLPKSIGVVIELILRES